MYKFVLTTFLHPPRISRTRLAFSKSPFVKGSLSLVVPLEKRFFSKGNSSILKRPRGGHTYVGKINLTTEIYQCIRMMSRPAGLPHTTRQHKEHVHLARTSRQPHVHPFLTRVRPGNHTYIRSPRALLRSIDACVCFVQSSNEVERK